MSISISAAVARPRAVEATQPAERMCPGSAGSTAQTRVDGSAALTALFPPRDADPDTRRAWLAASPWPEIVFASAH